jgi:hypothetical protein
VWQPGRGEAASGDCSTLNTSESPSAAVASSLSDVLEPRVHPRFFLTPAAAAGILKRAEKRGRPLPGPLLRELELTAGPGWREVPDELAEQAAAEAMTLWEDEEDETSASPSPGPWEPTGPPGDTGSTSSPAAPTSPGASTGSREASTTTTPGADSSSPRSPTRPGPSDTPAETTPRSPSEKPDSAIGFHLHERMDSPRDDGQAPTLMKSASPGANVGGSLRRLTPTECERLMGWPDGWTVRP